MFALKALAVLICSGLVAGSLLWASPDDVQPSCCQSSLKACSGSSSCTVCTNCKRCAYCKGGGSCGVCRKSAIGETR